MIKNWHKAGSAVKGGCAKRLELARPLRQNECIHPIVCSFDGSSTQLQIRQWRKCLYRSMQDDSDKTRILPGGTGGVARSEEDSDATRVVKPPPAGKLGDDNDPTEILPTTPDESDQTMLAPSATNDDRTVVVPPGAGQKDAAPRTADPDATRLADSGDTTQVVETQFDILDSAAMEAAQRYIEESRGATTGPTVGEVTTKPSGVVDDREFKPGSVLKDRFRLLEPLGQGGMGMVWKAVDNLKEEARDRNPFVAIKLLQGDFKEHPEAFIALQRETAKQQRLAHPNIATVFDFDRDIETVYMTMEVLIGNPLDSYIRKLPQGGLPVEEAMNVVEQLGAGLAYAHENKLVHSDLKPGNCFLTKDGTVKLLDFGIARASKTQGEAEGEKTLFDPGQLGALTPAYATIEMFAGEDPDPRDDIYAMACIAYQLFTGKHPFDKKSAPKAAKAKLVVPPVEKLNKRQNKALARALKFLRKNRTETVEEFLDGLRPKKSKIIPFSIAAVVIFGIIGALAYQPIVDYFDKQERDEVIAVIGGGDLGSIRAGLQRTAELQNPAQRKKIYEDDRTQSIIVGTVTRQINEGEKRGLRAGLDLLKDKLLDVDDEARALRRSIYEDDRTKKTIVDVITGEITKGGEEGLRDGLALLKGIKNPTLRTAIFGNSETQAAIVDVVTEVIKRDDANALENGLSLLNEIESDDLRLSVKEDGRLIVTIAAFIGSGDEDRILNSLRLIQPVESEGQRAINWQRAITEQDIARKAIFALYTHRMYAHIVPEKREFNYESAEAPLADLSALYPDSAEVFQIRRELQNHKSRQLNSLVAEYVQLRDTGKLLPSEEADDIGDVLELIRGIQSDHGILRDETLPSVFRKFAQQAIQQGDYESADNLLAGGLALRTGEEDLLSLQATVRTELKRRADAARADELSTILAPKLAGMTKVTDFKRAAEDIDELYSLAPKHDLFTKLRPSLEAALRSGLSRQRKAGEFAKAENDLWHFARPASTAFVVHQRTLLSEAEVRQGFAYTPTESRNHAVGQASRRIEDLVAKPAYDQSWMDALDEPFRVATAGLEAEGETIVRIKNSIIDVLLTRSRQARGDNRFGAANEALAKAQLFFPESPTLAVERQAIAAAATEYERKQAEARRLARIDGLKVEFNQAANKNDIEAARAVIGKLGEELASDAPYLTDDVPKILAAAFSRLAEQAAKQDDYESALQTVREGLEQAPALERLEQQRKTYRAAIAGKALAAQLRLPLAAPPPISEILPQAGNPISLPPEPLVGRADGLALSSGVLRAIPRQPLPKWAEKTLLGTPYPAVTDEFAAEVAATIESLSENAPIREMHPPLAAFAALFPDKAGAVRKTVATTVRLRIEKMAATAGFDELRVPLKDYSAVFPGYAETLNAAVAESMTTRIKVLAKRSPVAELNSPLSIFTEYFPTRADGLKSTISSVAAAGVERLAAERPLADMRNALDHFAELFPRQNAALRGRIADIAGDGLQKRAVDSPIENLEIPLRTFAEFFPDRADRLYDTVAVATAEKIESLANETELVDLKRTLDKYAELFPRQNAFLVGRVADIVGKRIEARAKESRVEDMEAPLSVFADYFPEHSERLHDVVASVTAAGIEAMAKETALIDMKLTLDKFSELFPRQSTFLKGKVADIVGKRIEKQAEERRLEEMEPRLVLFSEYFPVRAARLKDSVAVISAARIEALAGETPIAEIRTTLYTYADLFPRHADGMRETLADVYESKILALADSSETIEIAEPLRHFAELFPDRINTVSKAVSGKLSSKIRTLASAKSFRFDSLRTPLADYRNLFEDRYANLSREIGAIALQRLSAIGTPTPKKVTRLSGTLAQFESLFPELYGEFRGRLASTVDKQLASLDKNKKALHQYNELLKAAKTTLSGSSRIDKRRFKVPPTNSKLIAGKGATALKAGRLTAAQKVLAQVKAKQPDALNLPSFRRALEKKIATAQGDYKNFLKFKQANQANRGRGWLERAMSVWKDNPTYEKELAGVQGLKDTIQRGECSPKLAGRGRSPRATCFDDIAGARGPVLAVIPKGGSVSKTYAIGKYEVSIGEFNHYCRKTKACKSVRGKDKRLPVSDITIGQARKYAQWLSAQSKARYRLPSDAEWLHAAKAGGKQPKKDFNCRVMLGTQILKGHSTVNVTAGKTNGWGLKNYVGNVQEWTDSSKARGGAFEDPLSKCEIGTVRAHNGRRDAATGFRILREI